jgi:DNA-binding GntR family transcriptional regulator
MRVRPIDARELTAALQVRATLEALSAGLATIAAGDADTAAAVARRHVLDGTSAALAVA